MDAMLHNSCQQSKAAISVALQSTAAAVTVEDWKLFTQLAKTKDENRY